MKIAIFIALCEGEYEITLDTVRRVLDACPEHEFDLYIVDDASPSDVGGRIIEAVAATVGYTRLIRLPSSLGFWGCATRMMIALRAISEEDKTYDFVLKLDPDLFPVRLDLGREISKKCVNRAALYGCSSKLRKRDALLLVADLLPLGLRRKTTNGVSERKWSLSRTYNCWWTDLGLKSFIRGYQFTFMGGSFWLLGGDALTRIARAGILKRNDSKFGLTMGDDVMLTLMTLGVGSALVDLGSEDEAWQGTLGMGAEAPLPLIESARPYVVHPLKNKAPDWERRERLKALARDWQSRE